MLFNSIDFAIFFPIMYVIYWSINKTRLNIQNIFIVFSSYFFYACWDYRFLSLIIFSTIIDYFSALKIVSEKNQNKRKLILYVSIFSNLGILFFFKYFGFFIENFQSVFSFFGAKVNISSLNIILPVGVSFYTFQTLSYTIDVYRKNILPTRDFISFSAFVSFFPQLVAGPIERATNLLPQFYERRKFNFDQSVDGFRQILWGLFKKVVVADQCALVVNTIFDGYTEYSGSTLIIGAIFFSFQIYCDFSGYSDIAIGLSRLLGFNLKNNFSFPYFSRDVAEFWRRWHISLTTWFRDYVYIPLGGSNVNKYFKMRNVFIIFIISGLWHGANWTFIIWGLINAVFFIPLLLLKRNRNNISVIDKNKFNIRDFINILLTFSIITFGWIFFRSPNITIAYQYIVKIFTLSTFGIPEIFPSVTILFILFLLVTEWNSRSNNHALENISLKFSFFPRYLIYMFLSYSILLNMKFHESTEFIYFQF